MADLGFLTGFRVPVIVGICLCVGYVIKKWIKDVDNKWIPTVCAVLGVILAIWMNGWSVFSINHFKRLIQWISKHRFTSVIQTVFRERR